MGVRGPAPTPSAVLEKRGSWRAKQNRREPRPEPGRPVCPTWLNKDAKRAWKQLVPLLEAMRVLTKVDRNALARYVETWTRWRRCAQFIEKHGESYPVKDSKDRVLGFKAFPQAKLSLELSAQLSRLEQQFGMTPAARTRIEMIDDTDATDDDAKKRFIKFA